MISAPFPTAQPEGEPSQSSAEQAEGCRLRDAFRSNVKSVEEHVCSWGHGETDHKCFPLWIGLYFTPNPRAMKFADVFLQHNIRGGLPTAARHHDPH